MIIDKNLALYSTISTCIALRSASLYTATVWMPSRFADLITRQAISPLFAIKIFDRGVTFGAVLVALASELL